MRDARSSQAVEQGGIMDTARNKDVARRLYALINEGRIEQVADLVSPDYQEHDRSSDKARAEKAQSTGSR